MKLRPALFIFALLLAFQAADAQSYLILRKKGSMRKYTFWRGNEMVYKMKGYDAFFADRITDFADSTIILENNIILISQLEVVDVRNAESNRAPLLRSAEGVLPVIGIGLFALDIFNHSVIDGNELSLDERTTTTAAAMVATGYALKLMRRKYIRLNKPKFEAYIVGQ